MFEHRSSPLLHKSKYLRRLAASSSIGAGIIAVSLAIGMLGYREFEHMPWIDAFANAAMILSGMGPLTPLATDAGKLFAGLYALYSGLALVTSIGIVFAPMLHRFLHRFHLEEEKQK